MMYSILSLSASPLCEEWRQDFFKMKTTSNMTKLFTAYAQRKGVQPDSLRFCLYGVKLHKETTAKDIGLEDGDQIDCFIEQTGDGGRSSPTRIAYWNIRTFEEVSSTTYE
jgi:hypothetical protein